MSDQIRSFGVNSQGDEIFLITLMHSEGMKANILTWGASLQSLFVKSRSGELIDIVLGFDNIESYESQGWRCGAIIGRTCSRIKSGQILVASNLVQLSQNEGSNHLHGGFLGFDKKNWEIVSVTQDEVTLRYISVDGEEGYPATLTIDVIYTLSADALKITWLAEADSPTYCNPTTHVYFNLSGHDSGQLTDHWMQLDASLVAERDEQNLFTGRTLSVKGLNTDFLQFKSMVETDMIQSACFLFDPSSKMKRIGHVKSEKTGCAMTVFSDEVACLYYGGIFITAKPLGKGGVRYSPNSGFCLEPMQVPGLGSKWGLVEIGPDTSFKRSIKYQFCTH